MKKREIYKVAQICVINSNTLCSVDKLEVLRELMDREDTVQLLEKLEEKEDA